MEEPKKVRVYVAGALSGSSLRYLENMRRMIVFSTNLWMLGLSPYCPGLDYHYALMRHEMDDQPTVQQFYDASLPWVEVSDAMIVLPRWENSRGTKGEIELAHKFHVPVFFIPSCLLSYLDAEQDPTLDVLFEKWGGEEAV